MWIALKAKDFFSFLAYIIFFVIIIFGYSCDKQTSRHATQIGKHMSLATLCVNWKERLTSRTNLLTRFFVFKLFAYLSHPKLTIIHIARLKKTLIGWIFVFLINSATKLYSLKESARKLARLHWVVSDLMLFVSHMHKPAMHNIQNNAMQIAVFETYVPFLKVIKGL